MHGSAPPEPGGIGQHPDRATGVGQHLPQVQSLGVETMAEGRGQGTHPNGGTAGRVGGHGEGHRAGHPVPGQGGPQVVEHRRQAIPVETIDLVQDEHELVGRVGERSNELLVEHPVVVLDGVEDPDHPVDVGQQGLDGRPMGGVDAVHVGEIEQGDPREALVHHPVPHRQAIEQLPESGLGPGRHPGKGPRGVRPQCAHLGDGLSGQGVEQARLARPGTAEKGQHQGPPGVPPPIAGDVGLRPGLREVVGVHLPVGQGHHQVEAVDDGDQLTHGASPSSRSRASSAPEGGGPTRERKREASSSRTRRRSSANLRRMSTAAPIKAAERRTVPSSGRKAGSREARRRASTSRRARRRRNLVRPHALAARTGRPFAHSPMTRSASSAVSGA